MKPNMSRTYGVLVVVVGMMLIVMAASPGAQRRRRPAADAGLPIATNTILQNPEAYYGKTVTMSAGVEHILSKTAFVIDQRKALGAKEVSAIGRPILVIAPHLTGLLDQKQYLLMRGQIVKLDTEAVAKLSAEYDLDLAPEIGAKYQGQPVLVATSVINSTYVELAGKPLAVSTTPPPVNGMAK